MDKQITPPPSSRQLKAKSAFVVVCGMPRSGTRQFTDFLNRHPSICIQGEIRHSLIPSLRKMMIAGDIAYGADSSAKLYWGKRARTIVENFAGFSKGKREFKPKATIFGFKTPRVERYHKDLTLIVGDTFEKTAYFYCIRNIVDCYLSLVEMPWFGSGPNSFIDLYVASLNDAVTLANISKQSGDRIAFSVLNLDDFIQSDTKARWIYDRMFSTLPINTGLPWFENIVTNTANRNATENTVGKKRAKMLSGAAVEVFQRRQADIEKAVGEFNLAFSENLSCNLSVVELSA